MIAPLLLCSIFATPALAASASEWASRSIYQLVTDRFAMANGTGPPCDTSDRVYCGGSWQGVESHLDYIQGMGFDAIWISPVMANFEGNSTYGYAFHGYWPNDNTNINPHFGTSSDLLALSQALHSRDMYLMLDVVVNHMADTTATPDYATAFKPFNVQTDFHPFCWITDYSNQTNVEQCWLGDSNVALVDLDTENQSVITQLTSWVQGLVSQYNADGIRIDTAKHIRQDFWPGFTAAAGVFSMGEVLDNTTTYIAPYTQVMDSVLDYATWYPLVAAFQTPYGNFSALASTVQTIQSTYKNGAFRLGSFLENHDQPRFPSLTNDTALIANALTFPFIHDGLPILYYGQEQSYSGGPDPANREALWFSGYETDKPLVKQVTSLNGARKAAIAANSNFLSTAMTFPVLETNTMVISKPPLLGLFTNIGASGSASWTVPANSSGYAANTALVDVISCTTLSADSSGGVSAQSTGGMPMILLPVSALNGSCASLGTNTNATGSGNGTSTGGKSAASGVHAAASFVGVAVLGAAIALLA